MPITFEGDTVSELTIDGEVVSEVTMDGDVVWTAPEPEPTVLYIDDFERGNLDPYSGAVGTEYTIDTTRATSGSNSLLSTGFNYENLIAAEGGSLPRYPSPGDTISMDIYGTGSWGIEFNFARVSTTDRCIVDISYNEHFLDEVAGGTRTNRGWTGSGAPADQWLTLSIDWNGDSTVDYRVYDQSASVLLSRNSTLSQPLQDSGTFGFVESNSTDTAEVWIDSIRLGDGPL